MARFAVLFVCLFVVVRFSSACCPLDEKRRQKTRDEEMSEEYRRDPCRTPEDVDIFNRNFGRAVDQCALLSSVFDGMKNITREEIYAGSFIAGVLYKLQLGSSDAVESTSVALEALVQNCEKHPPNLLKSIISNIIGKLLSENKLLNTQNAAKYANQFANAIKDVAKVIAGENCPRSQLLSIDLGFLDFINTVGIFSRDVRVPPQFIVRNEWRCEDRKAGPPQKNCPIANYSPSKPLLRQSDDVCKIRSKAIDIFVATFRDQVRRCKTLTNLFSVRPDVTPQEMSRGAYYVSLYLLGQNGADNPRELADFMTRFIRDVKPLKISQLEGVHARFVAKFLESGKLLDAKNAKSQAIKMARAMKKRADEVVDNRVPVTKVIAIQLGWRYFLDVDRLLSKETAPKMAYLYGNEWRCQAKSSE